MRAAALSADAIAELAHLYKEAELEYQLAYAANPFNASRATTAGRRRDEAKRPLFAAVPNPPSQEPTG